MTANKTAKIQFYEGTDEPVVPEIRLTRSKDGTTGQALFLFEKPQDAVDLPIPVVEQAGVELGEVEKRVKQDLHQLLPPEERSIVQAVGCFEQTPQPIQDEAKSAATPVRSDLCYLGNDGQQRARQWWSAKG